MGKSKIKLNVVLDIGKTNVKLIFLKGEKIIKEYKTKQKNSKFKNTIKVLSAEHIINWLIQNLRKESNKYILENFVCTAHAGGLAFIGFDNKEILACTDYEYGFDKFKKDFKKIVPKFTYSLTPLLEGGLNTGQQLFYISKKYPSILKKTKYILSYPQYIAWKLSKNYATEISYLGCHSYLWNFKKNEYSSLVKTLNLQNKFPPIKNAWDKIGGLSINNSEINILNGVHDSNASYLYFLKSKLKNFTLVSTGTWYITLNQQTSITKLKPNYDMLCGKNIFGKSVPTMRFMGGREYDILIKKLKISSKNYKISKIDLQKNLILPSYASGGPFKIKNHNLKKILSLPNEKKYALICIYISFVLNFVLDKMNSQNNLILDGPITKNKIIMNIIASLRYKQKTYKNNKEIGTGLGASMLFNMKRESILSLSFVTPSKKYRLDKYYRLWISKIEENNLLKSNK